MRQRHLHMLLAALAMGVLLAMAGVGRARSADPTWAPNSSDSSLQRISIQMQAV